MKPLSELEKYFRERQEKAKGVPGDDAMRLVAEVCWKGAADSLQAWLREADAWLSHRKDEEWLFDARMIRRYLLGTTRQEDGK